MIRLRFALGALLLAVALAGTFHATRADDGDDDAPPKPEPKKDEPRRKGRGGGKEPAGGEAVTPERKKQAIEKGVEWLKKQQASNGQFDYEDKPFALPFLKGR